MRLIYMLILTISHHIFLTREERYAIHDGKIVKTVGVSLPVWAESGMTSEPAEEVFCQYEISHIGAERSVRPTKNGYRIILPKKPPHILPRKPDDENWRKMDFEEQERWYAKNIVPVSSKNLLDCADGGSNGYLRFRFKTNYGEKKGTPSFHFVEIKKMEDLTESIL